MSTSVYGTCECDQCYRRLPKNEAHRIIISRERGHSSGSWRIGQSASYFTGRTYYANQDVWLCNECYAARRLEDARARRRHFLIAAVVVFGLWLYGTLNSDQTKSDAQPPRTASSQEAKAGAQSTRPASEPLAAPRQRR
jgi:hypothetical protein